VIGHSTLLALGFVAGATILLGLPVGRLRGLQATARAALSMLAGGIVVFLLVEVMGQAGGVTSISVRAALSGAGTPAAAALMTLLLAGGFALGLTGLAALEQALLRSAPAEDPLRLSFMIAAGIGLHNLSEGLAIGQAYAQGLGGLTTSLVVGFALHNATEGFGIMGPMVKAGRRASWRLILLLALIGGGPTFAGTLLGSLWTSAPLSVFVLALAGGSLLYVLKELFASVRRETAQTAIMAALAAGFSVGWATEVAADLAQPAAAQAVEADGDRIASPAALAGPPLSAPDAAAQERLAEGVLLERAMRPKILPDGTREYDLTASAFPWEVFPGARVEAWGYNRQVPGPLIRLRVGERVAFVVKNELPQPTTVHWHGLAVPDAQDGVPGVSQDAIPPGGTYTYRFRVTPQMLGTHLYHTHVNDDFQVDQGLHGVLIVDPARALSRRYDVDALYETSSFKLGGSEQENAFALDGKAYPEAPALRVALGQRVLLRLANSSAEESHVMHLHGYTFRIVARDGNPLARPIAANTVFLAPFQTADVAFTADNPGTWMFHCHILDHAVNPGPAGDGDAKRMAEMGGLATFIAVAPGRGRAPAAAPAGSMVRGAP
jgi:zinc transporter ZupT